MTSSTEATSTPKVAIDDIGSEEAFLAAIDETIKYFNDGDIVEGTIVKVDRDEVLLDIGYKTEGVIPSRELSIKHDVDPSEVVAVGDPVEALVLQKEDKEGRLILSKKRAQYERAWGTIEKIKEEDGVVTGTVIEVVKGGLILDIGLRGFLPASLVEMRRVRDLQPYVGRELEAKIIELDKNRNNVVLSRRAWLEQTQSEVRQTFLNTLQKGQIRKGVVSSIVNFGAFVDLGGVDGLVHVSELSWKHIDHPSEVVEVGQEVTVEVLDVDMDRERVSLSLKATQEDPWQQFARTHQIGQVVPGKVTKLVPFGAFVRVEEGIEGLVHISELAERHVEIPEQVVQVGTEIFVKIIDIDLDRRRISLSLKQANESIVVGQVEFDPTLYGMVAEYDEQGNYKYPEGFDPDSGEWLEGYETQRDEWERQYALAQERFEAHRKQVEEARAAEAAAEATASEEEAVPEEAAAEPAPAPSSNQNNGAAQAPAAQQPASGGALASDEALAALREKLAGGDG
ncbi:30S ribosomal protein S1 [Lipingzhangella sp. LS1_29]|uniref:30S ribosomal protein S1 n=1 Tax=Lipingzhangella rawalii TaxID=2055835 RepID=A0ABU2H208_9ACTN|nr:30S ribosomal protein S1 [Lipingzhangella rawalii]MDS1269326.1 30S ribosomal protein S1 [Lipingzhangella rawalii]